MNRKNRSILFLGIILCTWLIYTVDNYYERIGLSQGADRATIRAKCASIDVIREKKVALESAKKAEEKSKINTLEKDLSRLVRLGKFSDSVVQATASELKEACNILRDPAKKSKYDTEIAAQKVSGEAKKREGEKKKQQFLEGIVGAEVTGDYYEALGLSEKATSDEIKQKCDEKRSRLIAQEVKKKVERGQVTGAERNKLDAEVQELTKQVANINLVCGVLQDPDKKREYDQRRTAVQAKGTARIFNSIKSAVKNAKKDADVLLVSIIGPVLSKIPIPDVAAKVFNQKLAMRNMKIIQGPTGPNVRTGLGFTGTMFFNNLAVQATVYVVENRVRKMEYSLSMELPQYYNISNMFPSFKKLDRLSLPKGKFVLSSFEYFDQAGYDVKSGFNFIATLELTGPLAMLNKLKNQAKKMKSMIVRSEPIFFQGVIPRDVKKTAFRAKIPLYIGLDFAKVPKMPKSLKDIFKEITTDDFEFAVTAPQLVFTIEGGVRLVLTTQREPIRLSMFGRIEPTSFSLGMRMRNMLELKWFALGNAGIQLDFDEALLPAAAVLGIPFTGIGLNGQVELGKKGEARALLNLAGGARVSSSKIPDLVFDVEAKNIRFAHIISFASRIAMKTKLAKREIPVTNLPVINLERLRGYLSFEDTTIAQKAYPAGFAFEVDALVTKYRAGFSIDFKHTAGTIRGDGYVSDIDMNVKGKKIFSLTGPQFVTKAGKTVTGPHLIFDFDVKKPTEGTFGADGLFEVPAIDLKQKTHFLWRGWNLTADFETTYAGFTVLFGANIDLKKSEAALPEIDEQPKTEAVVTKKVGQQKKRLRWRGAQTDLPQLDEKQRKASTETKKEATPGRLQKMRLTFGFKGDFSKFLSEQARPAIEALKDEASAKLAQLNSEIANLSQKIAELGKKGEEATAAEITRVQKKIAEIKSKIEVLKRERTATKKPGQKIKLTAQISAQRTALGVKETYLQGLLKPGKRVIRGTSTVVSSATKALSDAKLLKTTVEKLLGGFSKMLGAIAKGVKIFQVKEAIGEFNSADIIAGKLPRLVSLVAELNVPDLPKVRIALRNLQFDFKKPRDSAMNIARELARGVRLAK